ncbi:MAG: hypothetical protein A3I11_06205 [Elusimicrobia bacterium RIFCSPLOWO2_02_FULL_39_32]|nr:MAG: hypothetical protein A2034_02665 [Elusimicrobia bacterium GWA2_38_7]OGR80956.1 MAG: hypothetical protein A3B80_04740 [Elusimicrobia bacterium RIFCSPHIGHO2_02_FULL_39_36]OGR91663.1 MAG: hypothetical protein A3I11_06205 [Elusimicrobia bacterium RIFCSPLOWO2_02_FULL_39_32]OGS00915.1 MAG: hypothetical protein A3G85_00335 [Elusimicrobia bacterium RIFCSPLOWO2_12_FULL_39_28]
MEIGYYHGWDQGYVKTQLDKLRNDGQRVKAAARIDADIQKLAIFWPYLHKVNITVKILKGCEPLRELIREFQGIAYRVFFCIKGQQIWLLHMIEKKQQKTPEGDKNLAYERMKDVLGWR